MTQSRSTAVLAATTTLGLAAATLMFALPGEAAPTPSTFSAEARGDVWRVNRIDADFSGDPTEPRLDVAQVVGLTGQAASPDRSKAFAVNLAGSPTPSGQVVGSSVAAQGLDTASATAVAGQAGTVSGVVDYKQAALTARGRWVGDDTCLDAGTPLTLSKATSQGAATAPGPIPEGTPPLLPVLTDVPVPTEIPTSPPSDFPTDLPTDLPTLPTDLPTSSPPITLPTLPTLPTTGLPTITLPAGTTHRAEGDVSMMMVAPASVEERTILEAVPGTTHRRRVATQVVGKLATPSAPAVTLFGGEATVSLTGDATLAAYSDGGANGSQVTWTPPTMKVTVDGQEYAVPTNGTALAVPYSKNEDVVAFLSAGKLLAAESAQGTLAQASVAALNVIVKDGDALALDADLFPMTVKAIAPTGGVDCTPVVVERVDPRLKVTGKHNGPKADRLTINAKPKAATAPITIYGANKKKLTVRRLDETGDRVLKLRDRNGKKPTKYVVKLGRTDLTKPDRGSIRLR